MAPLAPAPSSLRPSLAVAVEVLVEITSLSTFGLAGWRRKPSARFVCRPPIPGRNEHRHAYGRPHIFISSSVALHGQRPRVCAMVAVERQGEAGIVPPRRNAPAGRAVVE